MLGSCFVTGYVLPWYVCSLCWMFRRLWTFGLVLHCGIGRFRLLVVFSDSALLDGI